MKILVTGGAGFIGSHTVDLLLLKGHDVRILDNFTKTIHPEGRPSYIPKEVEVIEGDVRSKQDWIRALNGIDAVYHFAAYQDYLLDFSKFFHVNSVGTALLYEVIVEKNLSIKKIILASSQAVYGEGRYECENKHVIYPNIRKKDQLDRGQWDHICSICNKLLMPRFTNESIVNPQNQYAISKYSQELIAINLGKQYNIPTVVLRYSIVQGPRQSFYNAYSGACRIFCLSYYFKKHPVIYEDGNQLRDFVNIEDVVDANILVLEKDKINFDVFNVGGCRRYIIQNFAEIVRKVFDSNLRPKITKEYRLGDTRHISSDIHKLKAFGWRPKFSPEKSVIDYLKWLIDQENCKDVLEQASTKMKEMGVVHQLRN